MSKSIFGILLIFACASCTKEPISPQDGGDNYYPLRIGNYWVYEHVKIDTLGNETPLNLIDSIRISRDTTIQSKRYYVVEGLSFPNNGNSWELQAIIRNENGNIVSEDGSILFSSSNFTDTLWEYQGVHAGDTLYSMHLKMKAGEETVDVGAGSFSALAMQRIIYSNQPVAGVDNHRILNTHYSKGVGCVKEEYAYLSSPVRFEKRLVRYHINP